MNKYYTFNIYERYNSNKDAKDIITDIFYDITKDFARNNINIQCTKYLNKYLLNDTINEILSSETKEISIRQILILLGTFIDPKDSSELELFMYFLRTAYNINIGSKSIFDILIEVYDILMEGVYDYEF